MTTMGSGDANLRVLQGLVPGHSMVSIIGHDDALGSTRVTVAPELSSANIDQSVIAATPATVQVASTDANDTSDGSGLRTLRIFGLSTAGVVQNEVITTNGQTAVTSALTYSAVTGWRAVTVGSGTSNAGVIYVGSGSFSSGIPAVIMFTGDIGFNKGLSAIYRVPTAKILYLRAFSATLSSSQKDVEYLVETSADAVLWVTENAFGLEPGGVFPAAAIRAVPGIAAGTFVRIEAESSGASTAVSAVLGAELVDT